MEAFSNNLISKNILCKNFQRMYWGKSLDQCDPKACFGIQFNLFSSKQKPNEIKNNSGLQNTLSPKREKQSETTGSDLKQKRSLKKGTSPNRSPQTISLKSSIVNNIYQSPKNKYSSPSKTSVHRNQNDEVFFARQQLRHIQKQLRKFQTQQAQQKQNIEGRPKAEHHLSSNNLMTNQNHKFSLLNNQSHQRNEQPHFNFVKKEPQQVFYQNPTHLNGQNFQVKRSNQTQNSFNSPVKFTFQSPQKSRQPFVTQIIHPSIIVSPRKVIQNVKYQPSTLSYQQPRSPRKSYENVLVTKQINNQVFSTIREVNQTIQQSESQIQSKKKITQKLQKIETQRNQQERALQKQTILKELNKILFNESEKQQKSCKIQVIPLSPRSEQTSFISGNANHQTIELSCEQLMGLTQKKTSEQEQKIQESFVENSGAKTYSLSPSQKYNFERRPSHLPSIAIKLIENKLRSHNYQVSESFNSNQYLPSHPHESENQNHKSKSKMNDQTESRWKQLCSQNSQSFTLSKQSNSLPFKFKIEECRSQWITDGKIVGNQNFQNLQSSLIQLLQEDKETSNKLKNQRVIETNPQNIIHVNIFKDRTNLNAIGSDRHCSPRKSNDKKFKTLINNKVTFNSILEEEYSSSQIIKTQSQPHDSHNILTKNIIQNHTNNIAFDIPASRQNLDRDQSTVIGKYTFQSMEQRSH